MLPPRQIAEVMPVGIRFTLKGYVVLRLLPVAVLD